MQMLPHEPTWATVGLFSGASVALGAIATASIFSALNRRGTRSSEPTAKRQKLSPPSPGKPANQPDLQDEPPVQQQQLPEDEGQQQDAGPAVAAEAVAAADAPSTPDADTSEPHGLPHPDSVVDLQKLQELEQRVRSQQQLDCSLSNSSTATTAAAGSPGDLPMNTHALAHCLCS